jgi:hypothetical protein
MLIRLVDLAGNLYLSNMDRDTIEKFAPTGLIWASSPVLD